MKSISRLPPSWPTDTPACDGCPRRRRTFSRAVEAAERIVKDGKDAGEVVRRVRALFKRTAVEKVQLDLAEVIGEVLRLLDSYPARKHVSLDVVLDPDLPPVFADRVQLQQLV